MKKRSIIRSIGIAILLFIINAIFLALAQIITSNVAIAYLISYTLMIVLLIKLYQKDLKNDFKNLTKDFKKNKKELILVPLILIIIVYLLNALFFKICGIEAGNQLLAESELKESIFLMCLHTIIIAPIAEELIFKLPFKDNKKKPLYNALAITILFTLIHIFPESNPLAYLYLIAYFVLGVTFTYPFYKTNNVLLSIIVHIINNLINVMIILF